MFHKYQAEIGTRAGHKLKVQGGVGLRIYMGI